MISATISFAGQYFTCSWPDATASLMSWYRIAMCFVHRWFPGFWISARAPWLSHCNSVGTACLCPSSLSNCLLLLEWHDSQRYTLLRYLRVQVWIVFCCSSWSLHLPLGTRSLQLIVEYLCLQPSRNLSIHAGVMRWVYHSPCLCCTVGNKTVRMFESLGLCI
jgi:hypothetical protein